MRPVLDKAGRILAENLAPEESHSLQLDGTTFWVGELLSELDKEESRLFVELNLRREGEGVLVEGEISCAYLEECVRCLVVFQEGLRVPVRLHFSSRPFGEEETADFVAGKEAELHPLDRGRGNLKEALAEQLFMEVDRYPLHKPDCQGLCSVCGVDLNNVQCDHS